MDFRRRQLEAEIEKQDHAGDYTKLLPLTTEYAELIRQEYGNRSAKYASVLNDLGGIHRDIGNYEKAEELFVEGTAILAEVLGELNPNYATSLNNMAGLYRLMHKSEQSEQAFLSAIEIYRNALGEEHFLFVSAMNNLGLLYQDMEQYEKAEALHNRCKELLESAGDNVIALASTLNNLAALAQKTGRDIVASDLLEKVLGIYAAELGKEHPLYATALNNLAFSRYRNRDIEGAIQAYIEVEEIARKRFGEGSSYHIRSLNNLGQIYNLTGSKEKAKEYFDKANRRGT